MNLSYEDLVCGDAIPISGVGHIRSPKLKELNPTSGIGSQTYSIYLTILSLSREEFVAVAAGRAKSPVVEENLKELSTFEIATIKPSVVELLREAMAFFMSEDVSWNADMKEFQTFDKENSEPVGAINEKNFDDVRSLIMQLNCIDFNVQKEPTKHSSEQSKKAWERAQEFLKKSNKKSVADKSKSMGNVISKICACGCGYTLLNIYDLTVYQLYDQFFQIGYFRSVNLSDMMFSHYGGKQYDASAWEKPITKL